MQPLSASPKAGICYISFFMSSSCVCCQRWARHSLEECPLYNHVSVFLSVRRTQVLPISGLGLPKSNYRNPIDRERLCVYRLHTSSCKTQERDIMLPWLPLDYDMSSSSIKRFLSLMYSRYK